MKAKVLMFADNGNDLVYRSKELTPINTDLFYCNEGDESSPYYILAIKHKEDYYYFGTRCNLKGLQDITIEDVRNSMTHDAEHNLYFNKVELALCRSFSEDLYRKALISRDECIKNREKEDEERNKINEEWEAMEAERERVEKKKRRAEVDGIKAEKEKFFFDNKDILKENLTSFERLTAYAELNKKYQFNGVIKTFLDLIRKEGFTKKDCYVRRYSNRKISLEYAKLKKPIRECSLTNGETSYSIPAKLYDVLSIEDISNIA